MTTRSPQLQVGLLAALTVFATWLPIQAADMSIVERWMATNSGVRSVKINFTQTRSMKSIKVPARQSGTLYMDYGRNRFRWEAGVPTQTIVIKQGSGMTILRPIGKRYERRAYGSGSVAPGMSALAGGFPRSMSEFNRKYRVISTEKKHNTYRIETQPLGSAGRGVSRFTFVVQSSGYRLLGVEITLQDGSFINTVFNRVDLNAAMPASLFAPDLSGYTETKFD